MPRGKVLSNEEKIKITAYKDAGLSNRAIAKKINRSHHVINNFMRQGEDYNRNHFKGGNKKLTHRDHSLIFRTASSGNATAGQIQSTLNLPVTKRRVQQILKANTQFKWTKKMMKPPLTKQHKVERLQFAKNHMTWDEEWKNVIFSDEKKFNLDGPDGFKYYWHDLRKEKSVALSRNFGGGTLMIWAAFNYNSKTPICKITTKMNAEKYTKMLEDVLIPYIDKIKTETLVFQQDNAAVHNAKLTKQWFQQKKIQLMKWPSRSPDLNPIENLWGILSRNVYENSKQYRTVGELEKTVRNAWNKIDVAILEKLVCSMKNRIFQVINNNGGSTKY